jgi:putative DNA primase/helicase
MKISDLAESDFKKYFEARLQGHNLRKCGSGYVTTCVFHDDKAPSLSINFDKGAYKCHSGCGQGGILDFECKFSSCDKHTALKNIAEIVGQPQLFLSTGKAPDAIYSYVDANGKEIFQVLRLPGKRFTQRHKNEHGAWEYKTADVAVCPYHLDEIICASEVAICEGEKDADNLRAILRNQSGKFTATTSPRGAGKWRDTFAPYFSGKKVIIFQDNDDPGRAHALQVANSVYRYANGVKIVSCPDVKDVSDYLAVHTVQELIQLVKNTPTWKPEEPTATLFMTVSQFEEKSAEYIDWLVEGCIQRGSNGLIVARPKAGKSMVVLDLALALASGQKWLDFFVPKRSRVALVSREDVASLSQWRLKKLRANRQLSSVDLDGWLYINAKGLRPRVMLDNPEDIVKLISDLKCHQSEFLILDVFRVLHGVDENDSTLMQKLVIDPVNRIQDAVGCAVCLIHHTNKQADTTLTESIRGASAIAGFAEFVIGVRIEEEESWTREFLCELKASTPPEKFFFRILDTPENGIKLERVEWQRSARGNRKTTAETPF